MYHGHHQFDMAHAFAAHFLFGYFHTAAVAHDAFITNAFILTAGALIILYRSEDALAEQTIAFRFVSTIVDGLWLQHLSITSFKYRVGRSEADSYLGKCGSRTIIFFNSHIFYTDFKCSSNQNTRSVESLLFKSQIQSQTSQ